MIHTLHIVLAMRGRENESVCEGERKRRERGREKNEEEKGETTISPWSALTFSMTKLEPSGFLRRKEFLAVMEKLEIPWQRRRKILSQAKCVSDWKLRVSNQWCNQRDFFFEEILRSFADVL